MKNPKHRHPAVAAVAAVSLLLQPTAPLTAAAMRDARLLRRHPRRARRKRRRSPRRSRPLNLARSPLRGRRGCDDRARRRRLAARLRSASGGSILLYQPQISSWDKQKHLVAFSAVSYRTKGAEKPAVGTIKFEADTKVAVAERLVSLAEPEDHRSQLPDAAEGAGARDFHRNRQGDPRRRAGDRARSRARQSRQEPDRAEERRGHQGRSADDLLQQDARGDRQPRRRTDLESDQGERPEVRGQHELGPVPVRADEDVLPAQRRHVAEGDRRGEGSVVAGRDAARAASRKLPAEENWKDVKANLPGKTDRRVGDAEGVREHQAGRADSADR